MDGLASAMSMEGGSAPRSKLAERREEGEGKLPGNDIPAASAQIVDRQYGYLLSLHLLEHHLKLHSDSAQFIERF